jgi:hypothetical protein
LETDNAGWFQAQKLNPDVAELEKEKTYSQIRERKGILTTIKKFIL